MPLLAPHLREGLDVRLVKQAHALLSYGLLPPSLLGAMQEPERHQAGWLTPENIGGYSLLGTLLYLRPFWNGKEQLAWLVAAWSPADGDLAPLAVRNMDKRSYLGSVRRLQETGNIERFAQSMAHAEKPR